MVVVAVAGEGLVGLLVRRISDVSPSNRCFANATKRGGLAGFAFESRICPNDAGAPAAKRRMSMRTSLGIAAAEKTLAECRQLKRTKHHARHGGTTSAPPANPAQ
jgi:hypothetical protein